MQPKQGANSEAKKVMTADGKTPYDSVIYVIFLK